MCGLKLDIKVKYEDAIYVTPFVGVWIETLEFLTSFHKGLVTPFVGVWIETMNREGRKWIDLVTPFVGVWIETV